MAVTRARQAWPECPTADDSDVVGRLTWYAAVARRAPSKHNSQPWRFVVRPDALDVWADPARILPVTDPHRRELVISCGAAVELTTTAARAIGRSTAVAVLPQGDGPLVATVVEAGRWATTEMDERLLAAVPRRRTDRGPLDGDVLPAALAVELQGVAATAGAALRWVSTPGDRATLAALVAHADRLLLRRGAVDRELVGWLREPGSAAVDGVPADHTRGAAESCRAEFVQRDFSHAGSVPLPYRRLPDRPWLAVLCTPQDRAHDWLLAGRALAEVLLHARVAGANASYLTQPVEEAAVRVELQEQLRLPGAAQLVLRLGVGSRTPPTGRRSASDVTFHDTGSDGDGT